MGFENRTAELCDLSKMMVKSQEVAPTVHGGRCNPDVIHGNRRASFPEPGKDLSVTPGHIRSRGHDRDKGFLEEFGKGNAILAGSLSQEKSRLQLT